MNGVADVACRQMGFDFGVVSPAGCAAYGGGSVCGASGSPVAAKNVKCSGMELSLGECEFEPADDASGAPVLPHDAGRLGMIGSGAGLGPSTDPSFAKFPVVVIPRQNGKEEGSGENLLVGTALEDERLDEYGLRVVNVCEYDGTRVVETLNSKCAEWEVVRSPENPDEANQIVDRARSRLGEALYNIAFNNCEHFVEWCYSLPAESAQVTFAFVLAGGLVFSVIPFIGPAGLTLGGYVAHAAYVRVQRAWRERNLDEQRWPSCPPSATPVRVPEGWLTRLKRGKHRQARSKETEIAAKSMADEVRVPTEWVAKVRWPIFLEQLQEAAMAPGVVEICVNGSSHFNGRFKISKYHSLPPGAMVARLAICCLFLGAKAQDDSWNFSNFSAGRSGNPFRGSPIVTPGEEIDCSETCSRRHHCQDWPLRMCGKDPHCDTAVCLHKQLFPMLPLDVTFFFVIFMVSFLAGAPGIGGGGINVPLLMMLNRFTIKEAVPISHIAVMGNALSQLLFNTRLRHPSMSLRPLIHYEIAAVLLPAMLGGNSLGIVVSKVFPPTALVLLSLILLFFAAAKTMHKGLVAFRNSGPAKG
eukprot:s374_g54.t1